VGDVKQMQTFKKYFITLNVILLVSIFIFIYFKYNNHILIMISLFILTFIMIVNDYLRDVKYKNQPKHECISLFFSICIATILNYILSEINTAMLMYSLLFRIFRLEKSKLKTFIIIHSLLYFLVAVLTIKSKAPDFGIILLVLFIQLLAYFGVTGMLYNLKTLEIEKEEVKQLNEKLKLANLKLQEYAIEVEEVTISKERTRVAQELHDSLGHSLMALAMHLEFAKKICIAKPQNVEEVLEQSEKIAKSSINDLRKAVTLLNSEFEITNFDTSIEKLINNFYLVSNIKITYIKNISINDLSSLIKTSIYKTIQECITNSLKHGNATEINIEITATNENVEFIITNNGIVCNNIIKSNGLNGIENRINLLKGTVYYFSNNYLGFGIKVFIPI
jgi:signal transduction histidine kinase